MKRKLNSSPSDGRPSKRSQDEKDKLSLADRRRFAVLEQSTELPAEILNILTRQSDPCPTLSRPSICFAGRPNNLLDPFGDQKDDTLDCTSYCQENCKELFQEFFNELQADANELMTTYNLIGYNIFIGFHDAKGTHSSMYYESGSEFRAGYTTNDRKGIDLESVCQSYLSGNRVVIAEIRFPWEDDVIKLKRLNLKNPKYSIHLDKKHHRITLVYRL